MFITELLSSFVDMVRPETLKLALLPRYAERLSMCTAGGMNEDIIDEHHLENFRWHGRVISISRNIFYISCALVALTKTAQVFEAPPSVILVSVGISAASLACSLWAAWFFSTMLHHNYRETASIYADDPANAWPPFSALIS